MALIVMIFASILKDRRESIRFSEEFLKAGDFIANTEKNEK